MTERTNTLTRVIRKAGPVPVYRQLAEILEQDIKASSDFETAMRLPSEHDLAGEFQVSRVTVRQALDHLLSKGLIYKERGRGTYARSTHVRGMTGLDGFSTEVSRAGLHPGSALLGFELVVGLPDGMLPYIFQRSDAEQEYYRLQRARTANGEPIAFEEAYLPAPRYPDIESVNWEDASLFQLLVEKWGFEPAWADAVLQIGVANKIEASALQIAEGDPVMIAWRVSSTELDEVLEYTKSVYRSEECALTIRRHKLG